MKTALKHQILSNTRECTTSQMLTIRFISRLEDKSLTKMKSVRPLEVIHLIACFLNTKKGLRDQHIVD
jgi:hypothetical protein